MNKAQFKRLALVLVIPLLLLGWWMAEVELFIEHHFITECSPHKYTSPCFSIIASRTGALGWSNSGGVYMHFHARLDSGLNEDIISTAGSVVEIRNGAVVRREALGAGERQNLYIPANLGAGLYSGCFLEKYAGVESGRWHLRCGSSFSEEFRFADSSVNERFLNLSKIAAAEISRMMNVSRGRYIFSIFIPVGVFFLLSLLALVAVKIFSFVRYGVQRKQES